MKKNLIENREATKKYINEWLEGFQKAQALIPHMQNYLEIIDWELNAINNLPGIVDNDLLVDLNTRYNNELNYLKTSLPAIPKYESDRILSFDAIATSGTSSTYNIISSLQDKLEGEEYYAKYSTEYRKLQESQSRPDFIRNLILNLGNQQTLDRFERALKSYYATKSKTGERTSAAFEIRTLLDGIKGDLFNSARVLPKENMTWNMMAQRLVKGEINGLEYNELLNQEQKFSSLKDRLSTIGKEREGSSRTNLDDIWIEFLDHLYTLLNLVNFTNISNE